MRGWIVAAVIAFAAVAAWLLLLGPAPVLPPSPDAGGSIPTRGDDGEAPSLRGAGARPADEAAVRGAGPGTVAGTVRRGRLPIVAALSLLPGPASRESADDALLDLKDDAEPLAAGRSDGEGRYALTGVPSGPLLLVVGLEGGTLALRSVYVDPDRPRTTAHVALPDGTRSLGIRVHHADGRPFRGWVGIRPNRAEHDAPWHVATTDADGEARYEAVASGALRVTAARAPDLRATWAGVRSKDGSSTIELTIDLAALPLRGRVLSHSGDAVPGAAVLVTSLGDGQDSVATRTETDGSGAFAVARRAGVACHVKVSARGFREAFATAPATDADVELRLVPTASVRGRVREANTGRPVPGVPVFATGIAGSKWRLAQPAVRSVSGADGSFVLEGLAEREAAVFAFGAGWISEALPEVATEDEYVPVAVEVTPGEETVLNVPVVPSARLRGRVLLPGGGPAVGARVRVQEQGVSIGDSDLWEYPFGFVPDPPEALADTDGRFEVTTVLPNVRLYVRAAIEHVGTGTTETRVRAGETGEVEITLEAGPAEGAEWWIDLAVLSGESGQPLAATIEAPEAGETDALGRARLGPFRAPQVRVRAAAEDHFDAVQDVDAPPEGGREGSVSVALRPKRSCRIAGQVFTPAGSPAPAASLHWVASGVRRVGVGEFATADGQGRFRMERLACDLPAGELTAKWSEGERRWRATVTAQPGEDDLRLVLAEEPDDPRTRPGKVPVHDSTGRPVARAKAEVHVWTSSDMMPGRRFWLGRSRDVRDGVLTLEPEDWPIHLEVYGATDAAGVPLPLGAVWLGPFEDARGVDGLVVVLPPETTITGSVVDGGGKPVPGIQVEAAHDHAIPDARRGARTVHAKARTDARGAFSLRGLSADPYTIQVSCPPRFAAPALPPTPGGTQGLRVVLEERLSVVVEVRDADDRPVAGAFVRAAEDPNHLSWGVASHRLTATTYPDGRATLAGLEAGTRYALEVPAPWNREDLASVRLLDWVPESLTVRLPRRGTLEGEVVDAQGRGIPDVSIVAEAASEAFPNFHLSVTTDAEGRFRMEGVPPGRAVARVRHGPFQVESRHETDTPRTGWRIVHSPVGTLALRFEPTPRTGTPVTWRVAGKREGSRRPYVHTSPAAESFSGALALEGLVPGERYALWVHFPEEGLVAFAENVDPATNPRVLPVVREGRVRGRLRTPTGSPEVEMTNVRVWWNGIEALAADKPDGAFEIVGLPPGAYDLEASTYVGETRYEARLRVSTGADVVVDLEKDR